MPRSRRGWTIPVLLFATALLWTSPAWAHKLTVFAAVQGKAILGEAYFRGGSPVRAMPVAVLGPGGEKLGEIATDDEGKFTFEPRARVDHRFVVSAGEGHVGEFVVQAAELSASLAAHEGSAAPAAPAKNEPVKKDANVTPAQGDARRDEKQALETTARADDSTAALSARIEQMNQQVVELRKDLVHYQDEIRLHDILGGIGVILGIMGLAFYFLGVRRKERMKAKTKGFNATNDV